MPISSLEDAFLHELKDIYHAEKQLLRALPKMAKATEDQELRAMFEEHLEQTQGQVERLEQIFQMFDKAPRGEDLG